MNDDKILIEARGGCRCRPDLSPVLAANMSTIAESTAARLYAPRGLAFGGLSRVGKSAGDILDAAAGVADD